MPYWYAKFEELTARSAPERKYTLRYCMPSKKGAARRGRGGREMSEKREVMLRNTGR